MKKILVGIAVFALSISSTQAADKKIHGNGNFGCQNRDNFEKLTGYIAQKDKAAFEKGLMSGMASGDCVVFNAGESVIVVGGSWGTVKLRRRGDTTEYWTFVEAAK